MSARVHKIVDTLRRQETKYLCEAARVGTGRTPYFLKVAADDSKPSPLRSSGEEEPCTCPTYSPV